MATPDDSDFRILVGSNWIATPATYSSSRWLRFGADGRGQAIFGWGQTIYAKVLFSFELTVEKLIRLSYLASPAYGAFQGFDPEPGDVRKDLPYTLVGEEFRGMQSVVGQPFQSAWMLTLPQSPWPEGMTFPYPVPTEFYGYVIYEQRQKRPPG